MAFNENLGQILSLVDYVNIATPNNTSINSIGVDMSKFKRVIFFIQNGGLGAAGTVDGRLQSAASLAFATVHNLAGTNITQMTLNNTMTWTEVRADQVTFANSGDRYVRLNLTAGGNVLTSVGAIGIGSNAEQSPASQYNLNATYVYPGATCTV